MNYAYSANGTLYRENIDTFQDYPVREAKDIMSITKDLPLTLNDAPIRLRSANDKNHELKYSPDIDGPRLHGYAAGALATVTGGDALVWDQNSILMKKWQKTPMGIEFGSGKPKEHNAGKIVYQGWSDGLDIVGAGKDNMSRKVNVWDKLCMGNTCIDESGLKKMASGKIQTPIGIEVLNNDPGPLIQKNYGNNPGDRYGVGQFNNGAMRMYAANLYGPATVNMSLAKSDGTFDDVVVVDNKKNVKINGHLLLGNKFRMSGLGDAHANDQWLRLFDTNNKGYWGGFAAGAFWTQSGAFTGSDRNFKKNISSVPSEDINNLDRLRPSIYQYKNDSENKTRYGFIAQDVENVYPHLVNKGADGMRSLDYNGFIPILTGKIQKHFPTNDKLCVGDACISSEEIKALQSLLRSTKQ